MKRGETAPFLYAENLSFSLYNILMQSELFSSLSRSLSKDENVQLAWVFGSLAKKNATMESDLDVAVVTTKPLSSKDKSEIINQLANISGRSIDLVDLSQANPTLLKEVLTSGHLIVKKQENLLAEYLKKLWFDQADFQPYRQRVLDERRQSWINS